MAVRRTLQTKFACYGKMSTSSWSPEQSQARRLPALSDGLKPSNTPSLWMRKSHRESRRNLEVLAAREPIVTAEEIGLTTIQNHHHRSLTLPIRISCPNRQITIVNPVTPALRGKTPPRLPRVPYAAPRKDEDTL